MEATPSSSNSTTTANSLQREDNLNTQTVNTQNNYGSIDSYNSGASPTTVTHPGITRRHTSIGRQSTVDIDNTDNINNNNNSSNNEDNNSPIQIHNTKQSTRHKFKLKKHHSHTDANCKSFDSLEREMTLKDRQEAMNKRHPFGLPIWKPALYKKSRSVVRRANNALHSSPSSSPELFLDPGNIMWLIIFGWWLAIIMFILSIIMMLVPPNGRSYGLVMRELSLYLLWPFGRYVERHVEITPTVLDNSSDHSQSIDGNDNHDIEDQRDNNNGNDENTGLLSGRHHKKHGNKRSRFYKNIIYGFKLGPAGWFYYLLFFTIIAPVLMLVSTICWLCVITIPMAKLNYILVRHLRRHPLTLRFKSSPSSQSQFALTGKPTVILLCTYQAVGLQYYKYTYDGINIIFINLIPMIFFVIISDFVLKHYIPDSFICQPTFIFIMSLASVIPLSYFIGMGVSSVSAQSSMGVAAFINATFGSIIEIILYTVALMSGKSRLVEGSLIGSFLAGVLLMPGMSMISSGVKRKEQKFNAKSAGVTSTMLIMAIIGSLTPTIFYQMFGSFELKCVGCPDGPSNGTIACSRCYYDQLNPTIDPVYQNSVKPLMLLCAAILPSAYIIGLVFSLHTHVDMVWNSPKPPRDENRESYYQKLLPGHIISHLIHSHHHQQRQDPTHQDNPELQNKDSHSTIDEAPRHHSKIIAKSTINAKYPSSKEVHQDITTDALVSSTAPEGSTSIQVPSPAVAAFIHAKEPEEEEEEEEMAGHDSPNWGKLKSYTILCTCTLLYAIIAEILVDTVDLVMANIAVDEKFLGLTLFALVPNITEFMNAISFALYGNIVLSMEIGSAYALQVCLLQIPSMVAISYWYNYGKEELSQYTFSLVFPRWDVITVVFSVFLLTFIYQEGKANYFKGSILILSYVVMVVAFYFIPPFSETSILIGSSSTLH
ncbi:unnamed protein product [Cunninghamella blakesleeana]